MNQNIWNNLEMILTILWNEKINVQSNLILGVTGFLEI